jgi:hypothetical protein
LIGSRTKPGKGGIHLKSDSCNKAPNHLVARKAKTERQQSAAYQQTKGYHAWRNKNKYGRRELVENSIFRFKNSFGSKFLSRDEDNMKNEMIIKCQLLNKMFEIGKPISVRVA